MKIGRNQICPLCDSGLKYKKCCGAITDSLNVKKPQNLGFATFQPKDALERKQADDLIRQQQQGLGNGIVSFWSHGRRVVAVGSAIYHSEKWQTFPDFLSDYLKIMMGNEWGEAELKKLPHQMHPIAQWYQSYCKFQQKHCLKEGELFSAKPTGAAICYLGAAYGLYLLQHNIELQTHFLNRLRSHEQFQGAYHELIIASAFLRAGYNLELEDETDTKHKHCEFSATSPDTGKKYAIEVKARGVEGVLGRKEGVPSSRRDVTTSVTKQLKQALEKPSFDERMIFIDVNAPIVLNSEQPHWVDQAVRRLEDKERDLAVGEDAYVFITNAAFHHHLEQDHLGVEIYAHGLGKDFAKPGEKTLIQAYKEKQKHIDAYKITDQLRNYPNIPSFFDGKLSPETENERYIIGEKYHFENTNANDTIGELLHAVVTEHNETMSFIVRTDEGKTVLLSKKMTARMFEDYQKHPEAFFGIVKKQNKNSNDPFEFFDSLVEMYKCQSPKHLKESVAAFTSKTALDQMSEEDILLKYCEAIAVKVLQKNKLNDQ